MSFAVVEWLVMLFSWAIVTFVFEPEIRARFPATRTWVLVLVWATIAGRGFRLLDDADVTPESWVEISSSIVVGLYTLIGVAFAIGFWRARRARRKK